MNLLTGKGIDIGCGPDPILPGVDRFDVDQGDASRTPSRLASTHPQCPGV